MPKALCLIGLVTSILVLLLFTLDFVLGMAGMASSAPFQSAAPMMDVLFIIASGGITYVAWKTFREQK
jgi:hypothetical protein